MEVLNRGGWKRSEGSALMFQIKAAISKGPSGDTKMVVDESRDVWLQRVGEVLFTRGRVFRLVWKGNVIPFETTTEHRRDERGKDYISVRFRTFGSKVHAERHGVGPYHFSGEEERRQAMILAVEALRTFGGNYSGPDNPEGFHRIEHDGRIYTKRDFGMA